MKAVRILARYTVLEAMRAQIFPAVVVLSFGLLLSAYTLRGLHFGDSLPQFLLDSFAGTNLLFGAVLTIAAVSQLFYRDLEHRWFLMLRTRPVSISEILAGKALGILAIGALFILLNTGLAALLLALSEAADAGSALRLLPALALGNGFGLVVLATASLLIASLSTSLFTHLIVSILYAFVSLLHVAASEIAGEGNSLLTRSFGHAVSALFPDLGAFFAAPLLHSDGFDATAPLSRLLPYGAAFAAVYLLATVALLKRREL